jgi:hypothetical protein
VCADQASFSVPLTRTPMRGIRSACRAFAASRRPADDTGAVPQGVLGAKPAFHGTWKVALATSHLGEVVRFN